MGVPRFFCFFGCTNRSSGFVGLAATTPKMVSAAKLRLKFLVNNGKVFTDMRRWGSAPTMVHTNLSQMQWNSLSVLTTALNADDTCLVTHVAVLLTAGGAGLLGCGTSTQTRTMRFFRRPNCGRPLVYAGGARLELVQLECKLHRSSKLFRLITRHSRTPNILNKWDT